MPRYKRLIREIADWSLSYVNDVGKPVHSVTAAGNWDNKSNIYKISYVIYYLS